MLDHKTQDLTDVYALWKIAHPQMVLISLRLRPRAINTIFGLSWFSHGGGRKRQLGPSSCDQTYT